MSLIKTIYVQLLNDGAQVYRPVVAKMIAEKVYEIVQNDMSELDEEWEFKPGSKVIVENRYLSGGYALVASSNF